MCWYRGPKCVSTGVPDLLHRGPRFDGTGAPDLAAPGVLDLLVPGVPHLVQRGFGGTGAPDLVAQRVPEALQMHQRGPESVAGDLKRFPAT